MTTQAAVVIHRSNDDQSSSKSDTSRSCSLMTFYRDRSHKQMYEHHHNRANTCLPSTADGHHPALVLLHHKVLTCGCVCDERMEEIAQVFAEVNVKVEREVDRKCLDPQENPTGMVEEAAFRQLIKDIINGDSQFRGSCGVVEGELDILMEFVPVDKEGTVAADVTMLRSKLNVVLTLWCLVKKNHKLWCSLVQLPLNKVQIQEALSTLNHGCPVNATEAAWIQDKFMSVPCEPSVENSKLLICLAYWYSTPPTRPKGGINREQLINRIQVEARLWTGLYYFVLWVAVFVLFALALILSGSLDSCRDIRGNLETQLELARASDVTAVKGVYTYAKTFSDLLVNFVPVSEVYFGGSHVWTLQDGLKTFSKPIFIPPLMEPDPNEEEIPPAEFFISKSFTLQAWVAYPDSMAIPQEGLSLLRKRLAGEDSLSCWHWRFPPAFSYGAHDYGSDQPNGETALYEESISAPYPTMDHNETRRSVLHTLLVTERNITFMVDDHVQGEMTLSRPVTDCESQDITLGDKGLRLASVRFFPRRLTNVEVAQIFMAGSTWKDIGRVTTPQKMTKMTEVGSTSRLSLNKITEAEATSTETRDAMWTASALVTSNVLRGSTDSPYINDQHPITRREFDPVLGYPYWEIYSTPVYTDRTSKNIASGVQLPQREDAKGFTVSSWIKFHKENSGYFLSLAMPMFSADDVAQGNSDNPRWTGWENMCWMLWVGSSYTGFYSKTGIHGDASDGPTYFVADLDAPDAWQFLGKAYRHFVFSIDPHNYEHPFKVCIDGVCTGEIEIDKYSTLSNNSFPPAVNCANTGIIKAYSEPFKSAVMNQTKLFMNRRQMDNFHLTGYQMQVKFFDRLLTDDEIWRLFQNDPDPTDQSGRSIRQMQGCKLPAELQDNHVFRDGFGNGCYWYFQAKQGRPVVCNDPIVRRECPVACDYFERCWGARDLGSGQQFAAWKQQMEIRTRGAYGTMCVASSTTAEAEAVKCARNAPNFTHCHQLKANGMQVDCEPRDCSSFLMNNIAPNMTALLECLGDTRWVPEVDSPKFFVPCRAIIDHNMPECAWDDTGLENVTKAINQSKSWSLSFWYESLKSEFCAQPQVRLLDGSGATFAWIGPMEGLEEDIRRGNGWLGGCSKSAWLSAGYIGTGEMGYRGGYAGSMSADVQGIHAMPGTKHFVVMGRREDDTIELHMDDKSDTQSRTLLGLRGMSPTKEFLRVINVGGDIRMSPMTLRSFYPSAGEIGYWRFSQQVSQDKRVGPQDPLQSQLQKTVERKPYRYSQKTMLLVPPVLLLRRNEAGDCPSNNRIVNMIHAQNYESQCGDPYECGNNYDTSKAYTCPTTADAVGKHFGHPPVVVNGKSYYAEFLASITENAVIVREDDYIPSPAPATVRKTREFVDVLTNEATIVAFFYSVEFEIASLLKIRFDTSKGKVMHKTTIDHFIAVQDGTAALCLMLGGLGLVCLVLIVWDMVRTTLKQRKAYTDVREFVLSRLAACWGDFSLACISFVMMCLQLEQIRSSHAAMSGYVDELLDFDWDGTRDGGASVGDLIEVKRKFLFLLDDVENLFQYKSSISDLSTVLSICLLVRVVYTTNAHPRIELVTRTLELAFSDLLHFFALMVIIFFGFALLGTWMFGARREDFRDPIRALQIMVDSVLGPPGDLPLLDPMYSIVDVAYVVIFHFVCFFFMLNFVLAIIVDSYTKVMEEIRNCVVEQNVVSDICGVFYYRYLQSRYSFPLRKSITSYLASLDLKFVTLDDLYGMPGNEGHEIFADKEAAAAFYNCYARFSFLTDEEDTTDTPSSCDLSTMMALVMHKVDMMHSELQDIRQNPIEKKRPTHWTFHSC